MEEFGEIIVREVRIIWVGPNEERPSGLTVRVMVLGISHNAVYHYHTMPMTGPGGDGHLSIRVLCHFVSYPYVEKGGLRYYKGITGRYCLFKFTDKNEDGHTFKEITPCGFSSREPFRGINGEK